MINPVKLLAPLFLFVFVCSCSNKTSHIIVIDPGHGGAETGKLDDKWDVTSQKYIGSYLTGMKTKVDGKMIQEHIVVLELAKRVAYYLDLTKTNDGWLEFLEILKQFSDQKSYQRIEFQTFLSRTDSWNHNHSNPKAPEVNAPYRLYDYPDPKTKKMQMGRISYINSLKPELVVSLHTNPAGAGHPGGMAAVLSPSWKVFDTIRDIHLGKIDREVYYQSPWSKAWLITDPGWDSYEAARADTWVYFHGYRSNKDGTGINPDKKRGIRHNMFTWAYARKPGWEKNYNPQQPGTYAFNYPEFKEDGPFWDREKSKYETMRRHGGRLGYGGDNHSASDELLRFAQYGPRMQNRALNQYDSIGKVQIPYASTYSLPTFSNAIVAYLEIAYLNRQKDRHLILRHREEVARSLAVGIYSLFCGLKLKELKYNDKPPTGLPIDFDKYGSYFEDVVD